MSAMSTPQELSNVVSDPTNELNAQAVIHNVLKFKLLQRTTLYCVTCYVPYM